MNLLSGPNRPSREGEWTTGTAILFIVTLAAKGNVTLAARDAGMSRKSAYALRARDPLFAAAWQAAVRSASLARHDRAQGDVQPSVAASTSSTTGRPAKASAPHPDWRDRLFAELGRTGRESAMPAVPARLAARRPAR